MKKKEFEKPKKSSITTTASKKVEQPNEDLLIGKSGLRNVLPFRFYVKSIVTIWAILVAKNPKCKFLYFQMIDIYVPKSKFRAPKMAKTAVLELLESLKLISRKI